MGWVRGGRGGEMGDKEGVKDYQGGKVPIKLIVGSDRDACG